MQNLLTEEDRDWLHGLGLNLSAWRELTCAKLRGIALGELVNTARDGWVNAGALVDEVSKSITWNARVYEAWAYGFSSKIHAICATMSSFDADILLAASGFLNEDLHELRRASSDAVAQACNGLYGEGEDVDEEY